MNPQDSEGGQFAKMLEKPPLLPDPVFPRTGFLAAFGRSFFQRMLEEWGLPEMTSPIAGGEGSRQMVMLRVGWVAFWAFDLEAPSDEGVSGREAFLDRVKEPIRRPPPSMAAFTAEQHLLARGVLRIQITEGPSLPGQYEVVRLKTIGWYAARLELPQA